MFKCQICDKRYSRKKSLNQHMNIHDESKAFKCDVCMKLFTCKSNLIRHNRAHTGEKPFACQVCDRNFARKDQLVRHQAAHSEVRSFKCSVCPEGRYFKTKHEVNQHMVFHYEPKFSCKYCLYKCHRKTDLNKHEKIHEK